MKILRSIAAVIAGYIVFVACTLVFFKVAGQNPHQAAPLPIMLSSMAVGIAAAFLGGYLAAIIAGRRPLAHGISMALILALGAAASLASTIGHGAIWSQIAALALMAPSAAAGAWVRSRQQRR